jgi:hypothetical protein
MRRWRCSRAYRNDDAVNGDPYSVHFVSGLQTLDDTLAAQDLLALGHF